MSERSISQTAKAPVPAWLQVPVGLLQRKCACGQHAMGGECEQCKKKGLLQRRAIGQVAATHVPTSVQNVLSSGGHPIEEGVRGYMEGRFERDFSQVRVHSDQSAAESARDVNALAYTVGNHIVFASGEYRPLQSGGQQLLAHELTHVVQQANNCSSLQSASIEIAPDNALENEARNVARDFSRGVRIAPAQHTSAFAVQRQAGGAFMTGDAAGGCGICYRGDVKEIGNVAHRIIQMEFELSNPGLIPNFPVEIPKDKFILSKGLPDLILPTPTGVKIGEIKPANPEGFIEGEAKIVIYERLFQEKFKDKGITLERLDVPPPKVTAPFIDPLAVDCTQALLVTPSVRGVYGYACVPPFSYELRQRCKCKKGEEPKPKPFPVGDKVKVEEKKKEPSTEKKSDPVRPPGPEVLVPAAVAAAVIVAVVKFGGKRAMAPAMIVAALILVSKGAKASIGLEGDDALEALFKSAAENGAPLPPDLQEQIKNDPELRRILTEAAQTGNFSQAKQALGEKLTRVIAANRDQFTEEEIKELLTVTGESQGEIPNYEPTVESLRKALDAKKAGAKAADNGKAGSSGAVKSDQAPSADQSTTAPVPLPEASPQAHALVEGLKSKDTDGVKWTPELQRRLLEIANAASPALTDEDVKVLLSNVRSSKGKTPDELVQSIQRAIGARKKDQNGAGTGDTQGKTPDNSKTKAGQAAGDQQAGSKDNPPKDGAPAVSVNIDVLDPKMPRPPIDKSDAADYAKALKKMEWLTPGRTVIFHSKDTNFVIGKSFGALLAGRDADGVLYIGAVTVKTEAKVDADTWKVTIGGGAKLYTYSGQYGTLKGGVVLARNSK
jgi:predicted RNase H-like HicB family nuclease